MIIAHRGESILAPENTLAAINLAWKNNAQAVEIDVHLTSDNEIVVIHDKDTHRTGNSRLQVKKSTLQELLAVDIGVKKGKEWIGERIPTLKEVLSTVPEKGKVIIEVKCDGEIIPHLETVIKSSTLNSSQIEIISFDLEVLSKIKKSLPDYKMLWLLDLDYYLPRWLIWINKNKMVKTIIANNIDGIDVWAGKTITKEFVEYFKSYGLLVYAWTVNDEKTATKLFDFGVNAITTDRAGWLNNKLNS